MNEWMNGLVAAMKNDGIMIAIYNGVCVAAQNFSSDYRMDGMEWDTANGNSG